MFTVCDKGKQGQDLRMLSVRLEDEKNQRRKLEDEIEQLKCQLGQISFGADEINVSEIIFIVKLVVDKVHVHMHMHLQYLLMALLRIILYVYTYVHTQLVICNFYCIYTDVSVFAMHIQYYWL
jgi:hypothetical protein